jgi:hypothetical protein
MVARIKAHATIPLERATYQGILPIVQLPLVVVCAVTLCVEELDVFDVLALDELDVLALDVLDAATVVVVAADDESSDSEESSDDFVEVLLVFVALAAAACVAVVFATPSRHASTPPSDSMLATLSAVAALRARAARGLRRGRRAPARGGGVTGTGETVGSSMTRNVRMAREAGCRAR